MRSVIKGRDVLNVYWGECMTDTLEGMRGMLRPCSAALVRSTRATAAATALLELPGFRLAAALTVPSRRLPERAPATCHRLCLPVPALQRRHVSDENG